MVRDIKISLSISMMGFLEVLVKSGHEWEYTPV